MKTVVIVATILVLAACGAETATTAATSAAIKKREIEEGKKTEAQARRQIGEAMDQTRQRAKQDEEK